MKKDGNGEEDQHEDETRSDFSQKRFKDALSPFYTKMVVDKKDSITKTM
tara:strand:- start:592 stop:738 length:147 start_codon:yes stop_codon:yes gene_type:complete